jgi:hypothetical protein
MTGGRWPGAAARTSVGMRVWSRMAVLEAEVIRVGVMR